MTDKNLAFLNLMEQDQKRLWVKVLKIVQNSFNKSLAVHVLEAEVLILAIIRLMVE